MAVGGTTPNSCLAIAAPNCTETMPPRTSQMAGIRSSPVPALASVERVEVTGPHFHTGAPGPAPAADRTTRAVAHVEGTLHPSGVLHTRWPGRAIGRAHV